MPALLSAALVVARPTDVRGHLDVSRRPALTGWTLHAAVDFEDLWIWYCMVDPESHRNDGCYWHF